MENNNLSFEGLENRGAYSRRIRDSFDNNNLDYWWVSPSLKTQEIYITPKEYKEHLWEAFPTISRISIQVNSEGKPNLGVSGYSEFQIRNTKEKFEAKGYNYHQHTDKKGRKGRWWLIKTVNNLESIAGELKDIEPFLYETSKR
jgi:hypothetical protein